MDYILSLDRPYVALSGAKYASREVFTCVQGIMAATGEGSSMVPGGEPVAISSTTITTSELAAERADASLLACSGCSDLQRRLDKSETTRGKLRDALVLLKVCTGVTKVLGRLA